MEQLKENHGHQLDGLFHEYTWNYIADAILEGSIGEIWVDDAASPQVAALVLPKLKLYIMGGDVGHPAAREYLAGLPVFSKFLLVAPGWKELLYEVQQGKIIILKRYAFSSESLDVAKLEKIKGQLSENFNIERIDLPRAQQIADAKNEMSEDHMFGFRSPEDFVERGFGYCALEDQKIVCIASAGVVCSKGIEIQINTDKKYRGQGLASAVGAALILESLEKGIDPNWDAASEISAGLAKKLGYTPEDEYDMYFYTGSRFLVHLRNFLRRIRGKEI